MEILSTRILRIIFSLALSGIFLSGCSNYGLDVVKVDKDFFMLPGEGGNSGVIIGDSVVLVIDTKMKQGAERFHRWVEDRAKNKRIVIVNTHIHKDHTGGNHYYEDIEIIAGDYGTQFWLANNTREDMPNRWLSDTMEVNLGNETAIIENIGQAHTFDDVIVYLENRKVVFAGDIVLNGYHPYLDESSGSNVEDYIAAMDHITEKYVIKTVVPGHGELGTSQLIQNFRQYFVDLKAASEDIDQTDVMRKKYAKYLNLPVNKAGFDQTIKFIRSNASLR
ncbi:MAG: MBL fold metallo-hydrolase, partial [Chitinophagales bacterium]|nr:MBL fold metallo-hydrolase [Chitinophagales bacterium]